MAKPLRIAIFTINYAPDHFGVCPYATGIADHYAEQGHLVTVVTGVPHYPEWRRKPLPLNYAGSDSNPSVRRFNHFVPGKPGALSRILYEVSWLASAARALGSLSCDVAIGIVPSLSGAALAALASWRLGVPFGVVFQDLMGPSAAQSGYQGANRVARFARKVELTLARRAHCVGVISDAFTPYLESGGVARPRIHTVRNWWRRSAPLELRDVSRRRLGWSDQEFVCVHAGAMGQKQGLHNVIAAAALLKVDDVRFVLAGDGNDRRRLMTLVQKQGLTNVQFVAPQPPGAYESLLAASDLLIVNQRASVDEMALPSKLTSYFASGRPIVAAVALHSATSREIRAAKAGIVTPPDDPTKLAATIRYMRNSPDLMAAYSRNGRVYVESNLTAATSLAQYDGLLAHIVSSNGHASIFQEVPMQEVSRQPIP